MSDSGGLAGKNNSLSNIHRSPEIIMHFMMKTILCRATLRRETAVMDILSHLSLSDFTCLSDPKLVIDQTEAVQKD